MAALDSFITLTGTYPLLTAIVLFVLLYLARKPFHQSILAMGRIIGNAMRLWAKSVNVAVDKLTQRNREVLIAEGMDAVERRIEREFQRITSAVERDLEQYPATNRRVSEICASLEDDYAKTTDVPPALPNWISVIEGIAKIEHTGDSMVADTLEEINRSLQSQQKAALDAYRKSMSGRHALLQKMLSHWRQLQKTLGSVDQSISDLKYRAKRIDKFMDHFDEIRKKSDLAVRTLSSSSLTQFFVAGFVLMIAAGGAVINFNLIALPMSEMVGGASYIGPFKTSDVAGLVIIMVELSMGLFLLESLRITRLFPIIGSMDDKLRVRMIWITLSLLTILAGVESALAFMRDQIAADNMALRQTLASGDQIAASASMIPTLGQMIMGFILPFALAFVAIPLESFISASRTVIGILGVLLLRGFSFGIRVLGHLAYQISRFIARVYDLIIFPALWFEGILLEAITRRKPIQNDMDDIDAAPVMEPETPKS